MLLLKQRTKDDFNEKRRDGCVYGAVTRTLQRAIIQGQDILLPEIKAAFQ